MAADIESFITRWQNSGAAERSNYALFLSELCDLLGVDRPEPSVEDNQHNAYVIDRAFTRTEKDGHTAPVYLDLYKRGHFVLETKQGSSGTTGKVGHGKRGTKTWDKALEKAYNQARDYIGAIPSHEGRPPFLIVCDVGHLIEIYAEFSGTGGTYLRFPDPANHRIYLEELRDPAKRELLRQIWTEPHSLDPSKTAAKVTREVATTLSKLAISLEKDGHDPTLIATFLQRLLFTLFAEDVGLLPQQSFEDLLVKAVTAPQGFSVLITQLWKEMATGAAFSTVILQEVPHFNGGLFENPKALPLNKEQIEILLEAARKDWKEVEPAIFGTLLERALDPAERHKLGAHYTPRSYVERLIEPTLLAPLRKQWDATRAAAAQLHDKDQDLKARTEVENFHKHLTSLRILDPACGSGNFLYLALARLKELEAEVLDLFEELGGNRLLEMDNTKVRPSQFWGLEINGRAAAIAQLVLWIGYFQWHQKTTGSADTNDRPLLPKQNTILNQDAVLAYDEMIPRTDPETGKVLTIWDGRTTKPHPVTGKEVPDESHRKALFDYTNPRRTEWPEADYIIGNPPFLGASRMRDNLGDGYTEALRLAWKKHKPDSWDFVMYWWHQAAELVRDGKAQQFGFITTNSIHQTFNRRCIEPFLANEKKPVSITFAIPDHPWVDSADGAAVRIAMTVANQSSASGKLALVIEEEEREEGEHDIELSATKGFIAPNLKVGANLTSTSSLGANENLCNRGFCLFGSGFIVTPEIATSLELSSVAGARKIIHDYRNGRDLAASPRLVKVIDAFGSTAEELQNDHPGIFQHLLNTVKPERDNNKRESRKKLWWIFGEPNQKLREQLAGLPRYIATVETSKHRFFTFLDQSILPDNKLVNIAVADPASLALLSSPPHVAWALATGSKLGVGNDPVYVKTRCFETFPFPDLPEGPLKERLRDLGEQLDAHRKSRQAEHPDLTLTGMYNVLEKLRKEEPLTDKDKVIHDQGLVTLLKQIHDQIDQATYEAYGWSDLWQWQQDALRGTCYDPEDETTSQLEVEPGKLHEAIAPYLEKYEQVLLQRLVDLNHERAAEEAQGKIRYLRPEFQDPEGTQRATEQDLDLPASQKALVKASTQKLKWPKVLTQQVAALQPLLTELGPDPALLSQAFGNKAPKREKEIHEIIETLRTLGQL
ncbi:MAG: class I SAM-dependent DNA methyltransferase [Roseibacillus sp.]